MIRPDGTLRDSFNLRRGYWEAKDAADDLNAEIRAKLERGYPKTNILFEDSQRAVLIQNGQEVKGASDPNRAADPEYIVRLIGQVIKVSVETVAIVAGLG